MTHTPKTINTVMIIDDNELDQILYKRIMKRSNRVNEVISYTHAEEALKFLKRDDCESIDVILLDINMPRMDGFEFLAAATDQLGGSFTDAVVVMLTTSLAEQDKRRVEEFNIVKAYINKPLSLDDIDFIAEEIILAPEINPMITYKLKTTSF